MVATPHVCLIDTPLPLVNGFKEIGCNVLALRGAPEPQFNLAEALHEHGFTPDLVLQTESLGKRCLVAGLDTVDCPTLFWAIDPHLNGHWHSRYGRLFDVVLSTQQKWMEDLKGCGTPDVRWLPYFGRKSAWVPMEERHHDLAFAGRITRQRPVRKWMVEFLADKVGDRMAVEQSLPFGQMMDLYSHARIIPNESISGEINFRLFEAASCGCLVLSQDLGDEQNALFTPGQEIDTYADVVELDEKISRYLAHPRLIRAMGKAAHKRVRAEHMPRHRAATILAMARDAGRNRTAAPEKWTGLTLCGLLESAQTPQSAGDILKRLSRLAQDSDVAAATLRIQAMTGLKDLLTDNVRTILGGDLYADSAECNLAGSMTGLRLGEWDWAKAFWYRHQRNTARQSAPPATPASLLALWAKDLQRRGRLLQGGFPFDPRTHLPGSAAECLMLVLEQEPEHLPTLRLLETMLRPVMGQEHARVGFLSILTLHVRDDWRLALETALANLKSFRLQSGLEELALARDLAAAAGQATAFERALSGQDASGLLSDRLRS